MTLADLKSIPKLPTRFGPAQQVAYIVPDIDAAMAHWKTLGVPAFLITRNVNPLQNAFYRGEKSGKTPVNIAFGYHGDMQIELIEALDDTPSIYTEAIERNITGVHHYAVCVENFPACYNFALDNSYEAVVDSGEDQEFKLASLIPKGAIIRSLGGFLLKKLTGQIKPTHRTG